MSFTETPEQALLREAVAKIASRYGHDWYVAKAKADERPVELWDELARNGYLGVNLPEEYGGGGMGITELALVLEEITAQGCPLFITIVSPAICGTVLAKFGSDELKKRWLPGLCSAELKMAFAITEPDAGSNTHRLTTTATRDGEEYRIRGQKVFISGVDEAAAMLLVARTGTDPDTGHALLSLFVVETDRPGLHWDVIPVEVTAPDRQYTVFFDDVVVPASNLIGEENRGFRTVFAGLNPERIMVAALCNGISRYALDKAVAYATERKVWDVPIGAHQGVSHPLAKAKVEFELARLMTQKAAWLYDNELEAGEASNMAKYAAAEASLACLDQAIQVHGGNGLTSEYGLADLWFTARLMRTAPVSREMVLNFVAQQSLGLPKSY
ncbi:MAG TPA: acyl-CoA dehydrogenase family protein [Acidimicrobiia bacterium]|nr:acyl-CoA dehydrogenase family protein [Acidimicrobiia bacterium]